MRLDIENLLREAGHTIIMPSYKRLMTGEIEEKAPGEVVTMIDRQTENANPLYEALPILRIT